MLLREVLRRLVVGENAYSDENHPNDVKNAIDHLAQRGYRKEGRGLPYQCRLLRAQALMHRPQRLPALATKI